MKKIFTDENEEYGLDCSQAIWASDQLHQIYHDAKVQLSDADFMIENSENVVIMEYKNTNMRRRPCRLKTAGFRQGELSALLEITAPENRPFPDASADWRRRAVR